MAPPVVSAKLDLSFGTVWAAEFDPNNKDFLFVGGGGGETKAGVPNRIALIDASKKQDLALIADIELSRNEDAVSTLAVAHSNESEAVVYAGVNSSEADQKEGKNEHFRSFSIALPAKRKREPDGTVETAEKPTSGTSASKALGRASLFRAAPGERLETYQRVLRLSASVEGSTSRMGVIATGLAPAGEVVLFDASTATPDENAVVKRIRLDNRQEAADADVIQTSESSYVAAYCTDYEINICPVSLSGKARASEARLLYQYPIPDVFQSNRRPSFRALRFLTPKLIAAVMNLPGRSGVEILLVDVPSSEALEGTIILRKRLPKTVKSAVSFAASTLPGAAPTQNVQHVLAIADQGRNVAILTLDHSPKSNSGLSFSQHTLLREILPTGILNIALSTFAPPSTPKSAPPQHIKLASTTIGGVIVHTFPLTPYPSTPNAKEATRYTLQRPTSKRELAQITFSVFMAMLLIALGTVAMQAFLEIRGGTPEYLGAKNWIGQRGRDWLARPYIFENGKPEPWYDEYAADKRSKAASAADAGKQTIEQVYDSIKTSADSAASHVKQAATRSAAAVSNSASSGASVAQASASSASLNLADAVASLAAAATGDAASSDESGDATATGPKTKAIIVRDDAESGLSTEIHHDEDLVQAEHKRWEDLHEHERTAWRQKLVDAGHWVEAQGEAVLKGVFFGELAGVVGDAVRG